MKEGMRVAFERRKEKKWSFSVCSRSKVAFVRVIAISFSPSEHERKH